MFRLLQASVIIYLVIVFKGSINVMAGYDDTNDREVGIEWIEDYPPAYGDLEWTKEEAEGFYNRLGEKGWIKKFNYGDSSAWESDFENAFINGYDDYYIDAFDFAYFAGHGSSNYFRFSTDHDGEVFNRWAWPVFHGLHAIWDLIRLSMISLYE